MNVESEVLTLERGKAGRNRIKYHRKKLGRRGEMKAFLDRIPESSATGYLRMTEERTHIGKRKRGRREYLEKSGKQRDTSSREKIFIEKCPEARAEW